jgi:transcriptional regulator with XRE-family HTH domain
MYSLRMPAGDRPPRRGKFIANEQLRPLRKERGLSQARLAELAGCSQADIHRLETGNARTSAEWAERLAPHLGVEPRDLFPRAAGSPRLADGGGVDADIVRRAMAVARRWGRGDDPWTPDVLTLVYNLLARERDGRLITDDEPTLSLIDAFVRRLRGDLPPR